MNDGYDYFELPWKKLRSQVQNLAKSAADHCVAMRIYKEDSAKSTAKLHEPAKEAYSQFETAARFHSGSVFQLFLSHLEVPGPLAFSLVGL